MKAVNSWITYRTRFLVKAKQLSASLTFTDVLARQQSGVRGDYLVESSDGVLSIASRRIFEDVYVPLLQTETARRKELSPPREPGVPLSVHLARKSPQPYRDRRNPGQGLRSV